MYVKPDVNFDSTERIIKTATGVSGDNSRRSQSTSRYLDWLPNPTFKCPCLVSLIDYSVLLVQKGVFQTSTQWHKTTQQDGSSFI